MELKEHLKAHRTRLGLSQEELAERIFVSRQTISNWETDRTYPDVQSLLLLSSLFDVSLDELVKGDVETMEKEIKAEWKKMERLILLAWAFIGVGIVFLVAAFAWETGPSSILSGFTEGELLGLVVFLLFWLCGMELLSRVERMKKEHDLVTYGDILAFSKGEEPVRNEEAFSRRHPWADAGLKFGVCAVLGAMVGFVVAHFF